MPGKRIASPFLLVFALLISGVCPAEAAANPRRSGGDRLKTSSAGGGLLGRIGKSSRLVKQDALDYDVLINASDAVDQRKRRSTLLARSGSVCAVVVTQTRTTCKAAGLEQSGYHPDLRLPVTSGWQIVYRATILPLAVVMPNPRSPPVAPSAHRQASAI